jgi:hypothetical protein
MPRAKADATIDFHFCTAEEMLTELRLRWSREWRGLARVMVIHGSGEVLKAELRRWAEETGISWSPVNGNPGATWLHPGTALQSAPGPLHRPLHAKLKVVTPPPPSPPPPREPEDEELFAQELERLDRLGRKPGNRY